MTKKITVATFLVVRTLKKAVAGTVYSTTNFSMFKTLKYNRGLDNGIDPKRVQSFVKLYERGEYFENVIHLFINLSGVIIDGHHKLEMHKKFGLPINFVILPQKEFNEGTDAQILAAIARFNAKTSKWDGVAHFNTAVLCKEELALEIAKVKAVYDEKYGFKKNLLTPSRIFAILTEDRKGLGSAVKNVEDYCRTELISEMSTKKFKNEFAFVSAILSLVHEWNKVYKDVNFIQPFFLIRHIMPKVWDNKLNMKEFYHNLSKRRFANVSNTMNAVGVLVEEVANMKIKSNIPVMSW